MNQIWFPEVDFLKAVPLKGLPALASNNVYILGRGPVTLIDTGIRAPGALEPIEQALNELGLDFTAVERIVLTHGHIDHYGQAAAILRAAGHPVEVLIHAADAGRLREPWTAERWLKLASELERLGLPPEQLAYIEARFGLINELAEPVADYGLLADGQIIAGDGWSLEVIHTPGHSAGSVCFLEAASGLLFCGDLILKNLFPSPFVEIDQPGLAGYRPYLASLERLENLPVKVILPGHGAACEDLAETCARYRRHQLLELQRVRSLLGEEPATLYEMSAKAYPQSLKRDPFLSMMKTAVYLEELASEIAVTAAGYALALR